ncbi:FixH family protein [Campylobacter insulaenigrae]|uniref:FixH family protein n=2 Tax=Campylobacter insulaenigrae TaxID=260714 RepID=UPI000F82CE79|nr:FixH family protein [Campylobacter insulaenigrae]MCR6581015.1 FixH family protein [Campylobacter insulaenigrae]
MKMEGKKTFWPYGILISLVLIVFACIVTILIASKAPVYEDNFYFDTYQNVELNYNEIQNRQKEFDNNFKLILNNDNFKSKNNTVYLINDGNDIIKIDIENFKDYDLKNLKVEALLTRPHTNKMDQKIEAKLLDSSLVFNLNIKEKGVWQLLVKITQNDDSVGFFKFYLKTK